jgi:hypothetical protein
VAEQRSCRREDSGVALVQGLAGVDTENAGIHDIVNPLGVQVTLLQEAQSIADTVFGVVSLV